MIGQWLRAPEITSLKKLVIDVKGYGEDWVVRPDDVQTRRQSLMVVQDQPSATIEAAMVSEEDHQIEHRPEEMPKKDMGVGGQTSVNSEQGVPPDAVQPSRQSALIVTDQPSALVVTEVVSGDGHQNNQFPEELSMEVTGDGGQNSVIFVHRQISNLAEPTPTFEEQLQQIDKALSGDCVSPILSAGNTDAVGVKLDSSSSAKSHVEQNKFIPNPVSHLTANVCGPDLHNFDVGFPGNKSKPRFWTRKRVRPKHTNSSTLWLNLV